MKDSFMYACASKSLQGLGTIPDKMTRLTTRNGRKGIEIPQNPPPPFACIEIRLVTDARNNVFSRKDYNVCGSDV